MISFDTCQVHDDESSQFAVSFFFALVSIWSWWAWHLFFHFLFCWTVSSSATMAMARLPCGSCWQCQKAPQPGWRTNRTDPEKGGKKMGKNRLKDDAGERGWNYVLTFLFQVWRCLKYESNHVQFAKRYCSILLLWFGRMLLYGFLYARYICLFSSLQILVQWRVWGPRLGHLWAESWPARLLFNDDLLEFDTVAWI